MHFKSSLGIVAQKTLFFICFCSSCEILAIFLVMSRNTEKLNIYLMVSIGETVGLVA